MSRITAVHSFRGGTGKSNITANIAVNIYLSGKRVGIIDTDIQSPGIHILFSLDREACRRSLNDYLLGKCRIAETAVDLKPKLKSSSEGGIYLVPSSIDAGDIAYILSRGYDINLLNNGLNDIIKELRLDHLIIDTHPGLNEETLLSIALSDKLVVVLRPDQQDYAGTGVLLEVARQLEIRDILIIANKVPGSLSGEMLKARISDDYECKEVLIVPHSDELMIYGSSGVFSLDYPDHELTGIFKKIAEEIE